MLIINWDPPKMIKCVLNGVRTKLIGLNFIVTCECV